MIWCTACLVGFEGDWGLLDGYPCWSCNDDRHLEWAPWLSHLDLDADAHVHTRRVDWPGMSPKEEESLVDR